MKVKKFSKNSRGNLLPAVAILIVVGLFCIASREGEWNENFILSSSTVSESNESPPSSAVSESNESPPSSTVSERNESPPSSPKRDFLKIGLTTGTDKVAGNDVLSLCLEKEDTCAHKEMEREACRPRGHFYDSIYNHWLEDYSRDDSDPFQFLEIGFYNGRGFEAYSQFLPRGEKHSMEISCIEAGPRSEGKWPVEWGNFAIKSPKYEELRASKRLHCGDANDYDFLHKTWTNEMKRPDAPPLKIVVDDAAHIAEHMATSLFFWLPRIEPGGLFVVEDIQPISEANAFRTHILPQVMKDLHWCGDPALKDTRCFPTIQPLLAGVHCEMHICVFVRNNVPSSEPSKAESMTPDNAFSGAQKCLFGPH